MHIYIYIYIHTYIDMLCVYIYIYTLGADPKGRGGRTDPRSDSKGRCEG